MKVVFISNFFNHHQKPFSDAMYKALEGQYVFVETSVMPEARKALGYVQYCEPYVKYYYENSDVIQKQIDDLNNLCLWYG